MTTYATYAQFTQVYSVKGITEADISSYWLTYGALRVNESLGGVYTTPFSSNNETAKDLSIHFGYLGILYRTRNQTDSEELQKEMERRIKAIVDDNMPMILSDGSNYFADTDTTLDAWSSTQDYKPVFDMRDDICQRVDPDLIDDLNDEDV